MTAYNLESLREKVKDSGSHYSINKKVETGGKSVKWEATCVCGKTSIKTGYDLIKYKSCGCIKYTRTCQYKETHGMSKTKIYARWSQLKARCKNVNNTAYKSYGGKGISVCKEWENFENFYNDMGDSYSDDLEIDRIDNSKGYNKKNCRWTTDKVNTRNRDNTRKISFKGVIKPIAEWCEILSLNYKKVLYRADIGCTELNNILGVVR